MTPFAVAGPRSARASGQRESKRGRVEGRGSSEIDISGAITRLFPASGLLPLEPTLTVELGCCARATILREVHCVARTTGADPAWLIGRNVFASSERDACRRAEAATIVGSNNPCIVRGCFGVSWQHGRWVGELPSSSSSLSLCSQRCFGAAASQQTHGTNTTGPHWHRFAVAG